MFDFQDEEPAPTRRRMLALLLAVTLGSGLVIALVVGGVAYIAFRSSSGDVVIDEAKLQVTGRHLSDMQVIVDDLLPVAPAASPPSGGVSLACARSDKGVTGPLLKLTWPLRDPVPPAAAVDAVTQKLVLLGWEPTGRNRPDGKALLYTFADGRRAIMLVSDAAIVPATATARPTPGSPPGLTVRGWMDDDDGCDT